MGHTVSDAAARSVKKGEKKAEKAARTDDQIFVDMEKLLDAHLSVTPTDIRLLLTRYKELKIVFNETTAKIAAEVVAAEKAKVLLTKTEVLLQQIAQQSVISEELAKTGYVIDTKEIGHGG